MMGPDEREDWRRILNDYWAAQGLPIAPRCGVSQGGVPPQEVASTPHKELAPDFPPVYHAPMASTRDYLRYLAIDCHGEDVTEFWDAAGNVDVVAARRYAEDLRERVARVDDCVIEITQTVNRVRIAISAN